MVESRSVMKRVPDPDDPTRLTDGTVVKIVKAEEPFAYVHLDDGTIVSTKMTILEAIRIDGRWDQQGQPIYSFTQNVSLTVAAPPSLLKEEHDS